MSAYLAPLGALAFCLLILGGLLCWKRRTLAVLAVLAIAGGSASAQVPPNDPLFSTDQHGLSLVCSDRSWSITGGGGAIECLVLDTGVNSSHVELTGKVLAGWSTFDGTSNVTDTWSHGTPCSAIIAANTNNSIGLAGVCWGATIRPIKGTDSFWSSTQAKDALNYAWHHYLPGATRPVLLSAPLTSWQLDTQVMAAAGKVYDNGGLIVSPTGNGGAWVNYAPDARYLMVGSCNLDGTRFPNSTYGPHVDMVAPNAMISITAAGTYTNATGTSFAAPVVVGVAALVLTLKPNLTVDQLIDCLIQGCEDVAPPGFDDETGWGVISAERALKVAANNY